MPSWAMHLPRARLDVAARTERLEQRLVHELQRDGYRPEWTAPEQIAALAVHELQAGNPWDAAVLLALASYRRVQQAEYALRYGGTAGLRVAREETRGHLDEDIYIEYVNHEAEVFRDATFDDELERVAARVGAASSDEEVAEDLTRIAMGNLSDPYNAQQTIAQRVATLEEPQPERLAHAPLAAALCARLIAESELDEHHEAALHYLASVPLRQYHAAALAKVRARFDGGVVRAGMRLYAEEPARVAAGLHSESAATRAHAATILGLASDLPRLPELEQRLQVERSEPVRRAIRFALIQLGEQQHLAALIEDAALADPDEQQHALVLLHWLPDDVKAQVPEQVFTRVIRAEGASPIAKVVAALALHDLAALRPLEDDSVRAMFEAVSAVHEIAPAVDHLARAIADLEQLDHARVIAALRARESPIEPWLARLGAIGQRHDLALLDRLMNADPPDPQRGWLVAAAAQIEAPEAQALLELWFANQPRLRRLIAITLVMRKDVDKQRLARLSAALPNEPATALLALALGRPSAAPRLNAYLRSEDPDVRYTAALAVKLFGGPEFRPGLWANAAYSDDRFYPDDVKLRQLALSALLDLGLNRVSIAGAD